MVTSSTLPASPSRYGALAAESQKGEPGWPDGYCDHDVSSYVSRTVPWHSVAGSALASIGHRGYPP